MMCAIVSRARNLDLSSWGIVRAGALLASASRVELTSGLLDWWWSLVFFYRAL